MNQGALLAFGVVLGLTALSGCGLTLSERVVEIANRCTTDTDCGASGRCIEDTCVATSADLGDLVVEVEVPAGAAYAPNTTHVLSPRDEDLVLTGDSAGFYEFHDLILTELVEVVTTLEVQNLSADCGGLADAEGHVPIRVELSPVEGVFGPIPPGVSTRIYDAATQPELLTNEVSMSVPAGSYDVYITPLVPDPPAEQPDPYAGCVLPPRLLRSRNVNDGRIADVVVFDPDKRGVSGSVEGINVNDWTVSLIDNKKGRLMSDIVPLTLAQQASNFTLAYWSENDSEGLDTVLRLSPPAGPAATLGAPIFYWKLSGLPGLSANVSIAQLGDVSPIAVSGTVIDADSDVSVPSILTIHSNELFLGFGENVIYRRTIETDAEGGFGGISLLPGQYTVIIQPVSGDDLAVTQDTLLLNKGNQGGVTLTVKRKRTLDGRARTAQGTNASNINAVLEPTIPAAATYLQNVKQIIPVPPSSASTITDSAGAFSLPVDPGRFNLSLRPAQTTNLPWTVVSSYHIDDTDEPIDDISLEIPNPVILFGQVIGNSRSIGNARIRAWLRPRVAMDTMGSTSEPPWVQVAETTSLDNGSFRLLLPGSLATISR